MRPAFFVLASGLALAGCNSTPAPTPKPVAAEPAKPVLTYPARPTVAAPAFKVTHYHEPSTTFTVVTKDNATNEEVEVLVWQLRDAARNGKLDTLKLKQPSGATDVRAHIYRGPKCAPETYVSGNPPCGASYHGAADFTFSRLPGGKLWDKGTIRTSDGKEMPLWDQEAPYTPAS